MEFQIRNGVLIDGLKKKAEKSMYDTSDLPDSMKPDSQTDSIAKEKVILNPHQKALAFKGRGPIASFVCTVLEIILKAVMNVFKLLFDIWVMIFKGIWNILFGFFDGIFGNLTPGKKTSCGKSYYMRYMITILFPPAGVFMAKGINGIFHIIVCCFLTLLLYFPGLVYAIIIMKGSKHNDE